MSRIYVASKKRLWVLEKTLPSWIKTELPVTLVVEPEDAEDYNKALNMFRMGYPGANLDLLVMEKSEQGLAYARRMGLEDADRRGLDAVIFCDDDVAIIDNPAPMLDFIRSTPGTAGVGIWFSIYKHFAGISQGTGPQPTTGSLGQQCVALRVRDYLEIGAYLFPFLAREDVDVVLRLIKAGLGPWYIHSDVSGKQIGKRHQPGGYSTFGKTIEERELHDLPELRRQHGEHLIRLVDTKHGKVTRINWKQAYREAGIDSRTFQRI